MDRAGPKAIPARPPDVERPMDRAGPAAEFEEIYRLHVGAVTAFFARRSADPQTVADLASETFVGAITSFATFDPSRGTARAWLFGIARKVFARYCEQVTRGRDTAVRLAGHRELGADEVEELVGRIDAERSGRVLVEGLAALPAVDREVLELVDIAGLAPREAAVALDISPGALRIRLFRARNKLRKLGSGSQGDSDDRE
jgi:RNA polymerase sigma-70 factor (ECF subfamily)